MRSFLGKLLIVTYLPWLYAGPAACETVMLPMPDGTRLATDIYLPDGQGPFPVVLVRTTYNKDNLNGIAKDFKQQGYASVMQDTRGKQKLIMGPWPHVVMQEYGDLKFPDNYNFDLSDYRRRFFRLKSSFFASVQIRVDLWLITTVRNLCARQRNWPLVVRITRMTRRQQ